MMKKLILLLLPLCLLTGCAKTTDIEDRNYTLVMGIDKYKDQLEVTYSFANLSKISSSPGEKELSNIVSIKGENLQKVQDRYKAFNDKKLELGHMSSIILGHDLVADDAMRARVIKELEDSTEYTRTVLFFFADESAKDIVSLDNEIQGLLSDNLNDMFYNNIQRGGNRPVTLEQVIQSINEETLVAIPRISSYEKKPALEAYDIFDSGTHTLMLSLEDYQLYLLLNGKLPYQTIWLNEIDVEFIKVKAKGTNPLKISGVIEVKNNVNKERVNREIRQALERLQQQIYYNKVKIETDFTVQ